MRLLFLTVIAVVVLSALGIIQLPFDLKQVVNYFRSEQGNQPVEEVQKENGTVREAIQKRVEQVEDRWEEAGK